MKFMNYVPINACATEILGSFMSVNGSDLVSELHGIVW